MRPRASFLARALASCEIGRDNRGTAVPGERAEGDPDPDPAEAGAKQDGSVRRARQPVIDDPLSGQSRGPSEVLAEHGAAGALGQRPARNGAMSKVLPMHHVRGVTAGGAEKTNVHSQGGKTMTRPHRVHRLDKRGLRVAQRPGLSPGYRPQEGETCQKSYKNLLFNRHSGQFGVAFQGSRPPKGVARLRSERLFSGPSAPARSRAG